MKREKANWLIYIVAFVKSSVFVLDVNACMPSAIACEGNSDMSDLDQCMRAGASLCDREAVFFSA